MSGVKNKSGLKKGQTNNPNGRPPGRTNKVSHAARERIAQFVETDFDGYVEAVRGLSPKDKVKAMNDLFKLIVPRPISDEEKDGLYRLSGGLAHLFGRKEEE